MSDGTHCHYCREGGGTHTPDCPVAGTHTPAPAALAEWWREFDGVIQLAADMAVDVSLSAEEARNLLALVRLLRERGEALRRRGTDLRLEMETYRDELGYDGVSDEVLFWADADENWREIAGEEGL
jgi:hypothetical protein